MPPQFLLYLQDSERALEPVFAEQQSKMLQLIQAFQYLQEETRRAFTASGEARLPLSVADPLNQVSARIDLNKSRMRGVQETKNPVDKELRMRMFGDSLIDTGTAISEAQRVIQDVLQVID